MQICARHFFTCLSGLINDLARAIWLWTGKKSFSNKQLSHQTKRNNKKLNSSQFKQQPICTPLAPTRNKIIYKTACSDGPNSGSGKPSQNRLRSKDPSCTRCSHRLCKGSGQHTGVLRCIALSSRFKIVSVPPSGNIQESS